MALWELRVGRRNHCLRKPNKKFVFGWNWQKAHRHETKDWVKAILNSLSSADQNTVKKRLGGNIKPYIHTKRRTLRVRRTAKKQLLEGIFSHRNQWKPDFLSKPPSLQKAAR